jgi:hypothetical protein
MVCTECRRAKVKCIKEEGDERCTRCVTKNLDCSPFKSRQGQRPKRLREDDSSEAPAEADVASSSSQPAAKAKSLLPKKRNCPLGSALDAAALTTEVTSEVPLGMRATHYGCLYLVRSWLSMAFVRRSMSLLSRAGSMACKCGFSMDQLMVEFPHQRGMDFLYPILLQPAPKQVALGPPLQYHELPKRMLKAAHCPPPVPAASATTASSNNAPTGNEVVAHRWIYAREMVKGVSRFFVSTAFAWDLASYAKIKQVYERNEGSVVGIFMPDEAFNLRAISHQISILSLPTTPPRASRMSNVKLRTTSNTIVTVDQVSCMEIINVDRAFYIMEFIPYPNSINNAISGNDAALNSEAVPGSLLRHPQNGPPRPSSTTSTQISVNLDDLNQDKELDFVLDLLMNS